MTRPDKPFEQFYRFETDDGAQIEITRRIYFERQDNPGKDLGEAYGEAIGIENPDVADKLGQGFAQLMSHQQPPRRRAAYEIKVREGGQEQQLVMGADVSEAVINAVQMLQTSDRMADLRGGGLV